jgi:CUB/sushi domain-containing protein
VSDSCLMQSECTDQVNGYICDCIPGITGANCETDIDECQSTPCQYNGNCTDKLNGYTCDCIPSTS